MYQMVHRRHTIEATAHTPAPPGAVYDLLRDGSTWPMWTPINSFRLERAGQDEPEGVGAIRVFRTVRAPKPVTMRERVAELVPQRRFSYEALSGLAVRDYRADVDLTPDGTGTTIHWRSAFNAKVPGTGWLYRRALEPVIRRCVAGLAAESARRTSPAEG
ncbi:SRPBCC family protein [Kutzneria viridogrisea]|uniref:Polyketide cyclase/dehydrase n=2 Tax=Kutzneria TaxID=43356 RepID=W5W900_9PSEU|nr:SRPBCC family protein [Kutzneria albida]AHH94639.1 hypothetical protein KALB_1266 [Kutzneria albida DSM 43870]MBA8930307.1 uncharacterized protein YndB with AHSA1/START domain [Kutzneria viridogrisea]